MKKYVGGVDALVLASVKIAKNAQLVARIKYINFGMSSRSWMGENNGSSKTYKHLV